MDRDTRGPHLKKNPAYAPNGFAAGDLANLKKVLSGIPQPNGHAITSCAETRVKREPGGVFKKPWSGAGTGIEAFLKQRSSGRKGV